VGQDGFALEVAGLPVLTSRALALLEIDGRLCAPGTDEAAGVTVDWAARAIDGPGAWELVMTVTNGSSESRRVSRMDPLAADLPGTWAASYFRSAWGDEFRPEAGTSAAGVHLEVRSGRSSHGFSPWLGLEREDAAIVVAPAWSGNWHIDLTRDEEGRKDGSDRPADAPRLTAGVSPWRFHVDLAPGESVVAPSVVVAAGRTLDEASLTLTAAVGRAWIPRSVASDDLAVEWNHWWPYEDAEVSEDVIWRNAEAAARLGMGVATVDAGWFGDADAASDWMEQRGDWQHTNTARFPSGLRELGDGIRERGAKAGIWIEAEAVGAEAGLRREHPEVIAEGTSEHERDASYRVTTVSLDPAHPGFLGYVCMGSAEGRAHVASAMDAVVRETGAEWVKLDFNIDPDSGCARTDHGHGAGDGLLRHYEGLYAVLDAFRAAHPDVILEACSSGGLRIDLGLAKHVHCMFLSDPDYTEHALQVLWGASLVLPPVAILHWPWSQWRGDYEPSKLDFASLSREEFDTIVRAALLHRFGVSMRLVDLSDEQLESLRVHTALFRDVLAPLVRDGVLRRLTGQPQRQGAGERAPAFQLSSGDRHVVAAYRLRGGETPEALRPVGLVPDRDYRVTDLGSGGSRSAAGADLLRAGWSLADEGSEVSSWLLLVEPAPAAAAAG
jgi:alpha-galactosidase